MANETESLAKEVEQVRKTVLELQTLIANPDVQLVRSCTSCLSDSCNKDLAAPGTAQPG